MSWQRFQIYGKGAVRLRAIVKSAVSMGAAHDQILPWTVARKYRGKLEYELFEFYHHGIIHSLCIAFLFQEGKLTPCMGIGLCLAHAVLAFHRAVGTQIMYA